MILLNFYTSFVSNNVFVKETDCKHPIQASKMELFSKIAANNFLKPQNCNKNLENLAIWDKLPDFILENFATALVKLGQF